MDGEVKIVTVDATNVAQQRFFCYKSKPKTEGYRRKLEWLKQRFAEGMRIQILYEGERSVGFIEYIPGEFAWRAVQARGYMVVHCLWVVGKGKRKGYGSRLLSECVEDARKLQMHGVAMVTSSGNWLAGKKVLLANGFESVDQAPPSFDLLVAKLDDAPSPAFPQDWEARLGRYGPGLTIVRSDQCPYIENGVKRILEGASEMGIQARVVELENCQEVQDSAPSAYGVFNVVYDGRLLAYHYVSKTGLFKLLNSHPS
jgi:L-amino acid N-acyltransferase YncA